MSDRGNLWLVAVAGLGVFVIVTVVVTTSSPLSVDRWAFEVAGDVRASWLTDAARVLTTLGLIAVVGPAVLAAAAILLWRGHSGRAVALTAGAALTWAGVWIIKAMVDRARPPAPLVHTAGQSYPSAHAANSVGWLALSAALCAVISTRGGRAAAVLAGALLTVLVGLSRIYLRAHYLSDVVGGEAFALASYALAALGAQSWVRRRRESTWTAEGQTLPSDHDQDPAAAQGRRRGGRLPRAS